MCDVCQCDGCVKCVSVKGVSISVSVLACQCEGYQYKGCVKCVSVYGV